MKESDVMKGIRRCLDTWSISGVVKWYTRIQCGKIRIGAHFLQLSMPGTPDYLALMRGRQDQLIAVFIEAKSPDGRLRPEQIGFQTKHHNGQDVFVLTIRDAKHLHEFIAAHGFDLLGTIDV